MTPKPKLGELLVQAGLMDALDLERALGEQRRWGGRLGETIVRLGLVDEGRMLRLLSRAFGVPMISLRDKAPAPEAFERLSRELAEKYLCLPLFVKREGTVRTLFVGFADPTDLRTIDELAFRAGMPVKPVLASPIELREAIDRLYIRGVRASSLGEIEETPLAPEDTAPVLGAANLVSPDLPHELDEPVPARRSGDATRRATHAPEPSPRLAERPSTPPPLRSAIELPLPLELGSEGEPAPKPREISTRQILRALTRLLIEKNVIGRDELMERVREAGGRLDDDA